MTARLLAIAMTMAAGTLLAGGLNSQAHAVPIGPSDFTPEATVVNFDGLAIGTAVSSQFSGSGVVFSSPSGPGGVVSLGLPGQVLSVASAITLTFSVPVHRVGLDYVSSSSLYLELYDASNALIESVGNTALSGFLGLDVSAFVAKAVIHDSGFAFAIDNVRFQNPTAVPEPMSFLLTGIGIVAVGILWRKGRDAAHAG